MLKEIACTAYRVTGRRRTSLASWTRRHRHPVAIHKRKESNAP